MSAGAPFAHPRSRRARRNRDVGRRDLASESREYRELVTLLRRSRQDGRAGGGDDYIKLMAKEGRVLDTVDRVVNDARRHRIEQRSLLAQPAYVVAARVADTLRLVLKDLLAARSVEDVVMAFEDSERRSYLGLALILTAVVIMVMHAL